MRPASAGYAFAFNQGEISPLSTTRVGVASQPFAAIVDDVQDTATAIPLKNSHTAAITESYHSLRSQFLFYLSGHNRHFWGHVVAGDIKKKKNLKYPGSLSIRFRPENKLSVTGEIMNLIITLLRPTCRPVHHSINLCVCVCEGVGETCGLW